MMHEQGILSTRKVGCERLMTLRVNAVRTNTNELWLKDLIELAPGYDLHSQHVTLAPANYSWLEFQRWLTCQDSICSLNALPEIAYHIQECLDDDYGAVDDSLVDTDLGSYSAGDTIGHWDDCSKFFRLDSKNPHVGSNQKLQKRVPFVKLPGMSVGLFDCQLMGVFNLLRLTLNDVSGGFLSNKQRLGKTVEMLAVVALAAELRRSKNGVTNARKSAKPTKNNAPGANANASLPTATMASGAIATTSTPRSLLTCFPKVLPSLLRRPGTVPRSFWRLRRNLT